VRGKYSFCATSAGKEWVPSENGSTHAGCLGVTWTSLPIGHCLTFALRGRSSLWEDRWASIRQSTTRS
jgi:hypothetical protein